MNNNTIYYYYYYYYYYYPPPHTHILGLFLSSCIGFYGRYYECYTINV